MNETSDFGHSFAQKINGFFYRRKTDAHCAMPAMRSGLERISGYNVDDPIGNRVRAYSSLIHSEVVSAVDVLMHSDP